MHKSGRRRRRGSRKKRRGVPPLAQVGDVFQWIAMMDHCRRTACLRSRRCCDPQKRCIADNLNAIRLTFVRAAVRRGDIPAHVLGGYDGSHAKPFLHANEGNPRAAPAYTLSGAGAQ